MLVVTRSNQLRSSVLLQRLLYSIFMIKLMFDGVSMLNGVSTLLELTIESET